MRFYPRQDDYPIFILLPGPVRFISTRPTCFSEGSFSKKVKMVSSLREGPGDYNQAPDQFAQDVYHMDMSRGEKLSPGVMVRQIERHVVRGSPCRSRKLIAGDTTPDQA